MGQQIASNAFGANMEAGLVSALAKAPDATLAVLEVDEKYLPAMLTATGARVVVLLNLSRDQMDRAAEIWMLARRWRAALAAAPGCRVIANADDPLVAWAAGEARQVTWVAAGQRWHDDSWCCQLRIAPAPRRRGLVLRRVRTGGPGPLALVGDEVIDPRRPAFGTLDPGAARPGQPVQRRDRVRRG
jgi:hypothetical protein